MEIWMWVVAILVALLVVLPILAYFIWRLAAFIANVKSWFGN